MCTVDLEHKSGIKNRGGKDRLLMNCLVCKPFQVSELYIAGISFKMLKKYCVRRYGYILGIRVYKFAKDLALVKLT